jgi:hypothetical protein
MLRTIFEIYIYLQYLFEKDFERRALSYMVWDKHLKIDTLKIAVTGTAENKKFIESLNSNQLTKDIVLPQLPSINQLIIEIEKLLKEPYYYDIEIEYQRSKKKSKNGKPIWYSLYDGPKSIYALANHLKQLPFYEFYYRSWSESSHSANILNDNMEVNVNGKLDIYQIGNPKEAQYITKLFIHFTLNIYGLYISNRINDKMEEFKRWEKDMDKILYDLVQREYIMVK